MIKKLLLSHWAIILVATMAALVVFVQSRRAVPLIDYAYQVENAYRIFRGETPYKDFFLVLTPGTYVATALVMLLSGGFFQKTLIVYPIIIALLTIFLTYFIVKKIIKNQLVSVFLTIPLIAAGYSIFPFPIYDVDAGFAILVAFTAFVIAIEKNNLLLFFLAGFLAGVPFLFKQNMGVAFAGSAGLATVIAWARLPTKASARRAVVFIAGAAVAPLFFTLWLLYYGMLDEFLFQTVTFAGRMKDSNYNIREMAHVYLSLISFIPYLITISLLIMITGHMKTRVRFIAQLMLWNALWVFLLLRFSLFELHNYGISLIWAVGSVLVGILSIFQFFRTKTYKELVLSLFPFILVVTSHITFLAHSFGGSSYGIWPLFIIMVALTIARLSKILPHIDWKYAGITFSFFLLFILSDAIIQNRRLSGYVHTEGQIVKATHKRLQGLVTPGPWITHMEELLTFVEGNIPKDDRVVFLPGEDPFFAATGRVNPLPFSQMNLATFNVSVEQLGLLLTQHNVDWVIVKTAFQSRLGFVDLYPYVARIESSFNRITSLKGYDIYKAK